MSDPDETRVRVIHALRVMGFADVDRVCDGTGLEPAVVDDLVGDLAEQGLARYREGRITGWTLTAEGRDEAHRLIRDHVVHAVEEPALEEEYPTFLEINGPFKALCTRWQLEGQPPSCIVELRSLHTDVSALLTRLLPHAPRLERYPHRFDRALARLEGGDRGAFARPLTDSYHDVWMELHQEFLLSLGRERSEADGT